MKARAIATLGIVSALSCNPKPDLREAESIPALSPGCSFAERKAAACVAMRRAVLFDGGGNLIQTEVTRCEMAESFGEVEWRTLGEKASAYKAVVNLHADTPFESLRPTAITPIVLEWPSSFGGASDPRRLRVSVPRQCGSDADALPVDLSIPAVDETSCVGESRITMGHPNWCTQVPGGEGSHYTLRQWNAFLETRVRFVVADFAGDRATIRVGGRTVERADGSRLRALFEAMWELPSEREESCRDGALTVVEGRRAKGWKAVIRYCGVIVDMKRVEELISD